MAKSIKSLKAELDALEVEYNEDATAAELNGLLEEAKIAAEEDGEDDSDGADSKKSAKKGDDAIYVNIDKVVRTKEILALVTGKLVPRDGGETERKERYSQILAADNVDPKSAGAFRFVYEKLGGLVRSQSEQQKADQVAAELRRKNKKRAIEPDK